jgi:hypothetical protein
LRPECREEKAALEVRARLAEDGRQCPKCEELRALVLDRLDKLESLILAHASKP